MSEDFFIAVGKRIRELRQQLNISQEAFARAAAMNERYAWRVEHGRQNLSLLSLGRAAFALGVSPAALLEGIAVDASILRKSERSNARASGGPSTRSRSAAAAGGTPMGAPADAAAQPTPPVAASRRVGVNEFFIAKRPDGRFGVSKPEARRATAIAATRAEAVAKARALDPGAVIHIERVRDVGPGQDRWRRI